MTSFAELHYFFISIDVVKMILSKVDYALCARSKQYLKCPVVILQNGMA